MASRGRQKARAELQPILERLVAAINDITALRPEIRRRAERDTVQLALLIAKRILHRELSVDENALNGIARIAFERLSRLGVLYDHGASAFRRRHHCGSAWRRSLSRVTVHPDPSCDPGTLVIRSSEGVIDASVDAQLEEITRGLTDRLAHVLIMPIPIDFTRYNDFVNRRNRCVSKAKSWNSSA